MSYLVLARKYRPQTFDQVVEQDHVTRTLSNSITSNRVAHAVLFSGPRGTGKTTVARILSKAMNCQSGPPALPCNECRSCREITSGHAVDVFEIDGASNNSVDQVRELREHIKYMPAHSPFKIYIIDEVHMLSMPAFNALLKTLEEPPPHVMFIFATTEPQKIPITILSRCQRHDFRRISLKSIIAHMKTICQQEHFQIPEQSLVLIAREATGSMRDALSLLDQVLSCSEGEASHEQVLDILGVMDRKYVFDLCGTILQGDVGAVLNILDDCYNRGHDLKKLYEDLLEHFRNLLIVKLGHNIEKLVDLPASEIDQMMAQTKAVTASVLNQILDDLFREEAPIRLASDTKLALEMAFIRLDQIKPALPIDELIDKLDLLRQEIYNQPVDRPAAQTPGQGAVTSAGGRKTDDQQPGAPIEQQQIAAKVPSAAADPAADLTANWRKLYDIICKENPALAASLTKCRLKQVSADTVEIEVLDNGFTLKMLERDKNKAILNRVCTACWGAEKTVVLRTAAESDAESPKKKSQNDQDLKQKALSHPLVADAIEIFDGKLIDVKLR
ncbi:MAG: DNA polymerase III subunit gamma/tau [Deltaproteobacteria bacterium]|jgi:DNA polymerase-3 subunit gamma/tau|nr:DNA polymerase III subunit gamma/tau [Deltaproteobacteria bacterium]